MSRAALVDGRRMSHAQMAYLGAGRDALLVSRPETEPDGDAARVLLIGGEPFEEQLVMWWNFVVGSHEEIVAARSAWQDGAARFGSVHGGGRRLPAPPIPSLKLKPRGRI
jgi:redox-sensitive bicupin YhaK (pirin superfamily)